MIEEMVEKVLRQLDKACATVLVSTDPRRKRFIGEFLILGVILFLLRQYCAGFLKGLGLNEAAESHGEKTKEFLNRLRSGQATNADIEQTKKEIEAVVQDIRSKQIDSAAQSAAITGVERALLEAGTSSGQARDVAQCISEVVHGNERG